MGSTFATRGTSEYLLPLLLLIHTGLAFGLLHLPLSLQITVSSSEQVGAIQSLLVMLYPMALALTGLGAALAQRWPERAMGDGVLRVSGLSLLLFQFVAVGWTFLTDDGPEVVLHAILYALPLGGWFIALGMSVAGAVLRLRRVRVDRVGMGWALHLAALALGYLAADSMVEQIGVNGLVICMGMSLLILPRWSPLLFIALLGVHQAIDLEDRIETARQVALVEALPEVALAQARLESAQPSFSDIEEALPDDEPRSDLLSYLKNPEWTRWSRYGRMQVVRTDSDPPQLVVFYNTRRQFVLADKSQLSREEKKKRRTDSETIEGAQGQIRSQIYGRTVGMSRLLLSGVGSGRSLRRLGSGLHPGVVAVERDPNTVRFFRDVHPEAINDAMNSVTTLNKDGRHAIEIQAEPLDFISLESSRYQQGSSFLPITDAHTLYTPEAVQAYLEHLAPNGKMVVEVTRTTAHPARRFMAESVIRALNTQRVPYSLFITGEQESVSILVSRNANELRNWEQELANALSTGRRTVEFSQDWDPSVPSCTIPLTDDRPFMGWSCLTEEERSRIRWGAVVLVALLCVGGLGISWRGRRAPGWNSCRFFFVVGLAHTALQLHAFFAWRSFFGDQLLTILRVIVWFLLWGAIGGALARRIPDRWLELKPRMGSALLLLLLHWVLLEFIPHQQPNQVLRELFALVGTAPGGLLMGLYFPLGLVRASDRLVGLNLCADALGTLAGYGLMFLLALHLGIAAYGLVAMGLYLVATFDFPGACTRN